jgi:TonB family protein
MTEFEQKTNPEKPVVKADSIMGWKAWISPEQFLKIHPEIKKDDLKQNGNILLMIDENNPKDMENAKKLKLKLSPLDKVRLKELEVTRVPDDVFVVVEDMPEFPGGEEALRNWIAENVKYPVEAAEKGIQGKVYAMFVVEKDGSIGRSKVVRGVFPLLDEEALRVVNAMPKWKPGRQRGKEVAVSYTIPINFQLQGKKIDETVVVGYDKNGVSINDSIYQECEVMPVFAGGDLGVRKFIAENIKYPAEAKKYSEQGKVYVTFVIAKDGAVEKVKVVRGVTPALDNEAIRVVSTMPNWTPGKQKGEPVNVQYTIPVNFQLQ